MDASTRNTLMGVINAHQRLYDRIEDMTIDPLAIAFHEGYIGAMEDIFLAFGMQREEFPPALIRPLVIKGSLTPVTNRDSHQTPRDGTTMPERETAASDAQI